MGGTGGSIPSDDQHPRFHGLFYSEFTAFLGFVRNSDEWKVMDRRTANRESIYQKFIDLGSTLPRVHFA